MKKSLIILLLTSFLIVSCGKTQETNTKVEEVQQSKANIQTGSVDDNSGKIEEVLTGVTSSSGVESNSGISIIDNSKIDKISEELEKSSQPSYGNFVGIEDKGIKFRISESLSGTTKINSISLDNNFKLDISKLGIINLFTVTDKKFKNQQEILSKYFINSKYTDYCSLNSINTESDELFLNKNNWNIYNISINNTIKSSDIKEEILNNGYCFGIYPSAPKMYFIFKKDDLTKFLLINTTQDPYPFNPRSFEFYNEKPENNTNSSMSENSTFKKYSDTEKGFSFEYPKLWKEVIQNDKDGEGIDLYPLSKEKDPYGMSKIRISYWESILDNFNASNGKYKTLDTFIKDPIFNDIKEITFAGVKAYKGNESGFGSSEVIYTEYKGHIYAIIANDLDLPEIKQIISTFKFTK